MYPISAATDNSVLCPSLLLVTTLQGAADVSVSLQAQPVLNTTK